MLKIFKSRATDEMSLEEIQAARETHEHMTPAEREAEFAERGSAERRRDIESTARRMDLLRWQRSAKSELANDLEVSPEFLPTALMGRAAASVAKDPALDPIWLALTQAINENPDTTAAGAIQARVVLAATKSLPPVRRNDAAFGEPAGKDWRELPESAAKRIGVVDHVWLDPIAREAGIAADSFSHPDVHSIVRRHDEARRRIAKARDANQYDPCDYRRNHDMAERELKLVARQFADEGKAEIGAHARRGTELRTAVVALIDSHLRELPIGVAWWWARELRRHVAGERAQVSDVAIVWRMLGALGVRIPFATLKEQPR